MAKRVVITDPPESASINSMEDLALHVRYRRTNAKLSLVDAAALCSVSKQTYNNIELGKTGVNTDSLFKVLTGLGIELRISELTSESEWS